MPFTELDQAREKSLHLSSGSLEIITPTYSFPKSSIKVLMLEKVHQTAVDIFAKEAFDCIQVPTALSEADLIEQIKDVHILCIRSKTVVSAAVIEAANRLLCVGCFCIGTDQVDLFAAAARGIPVFNAPFANTRSVAELAIGELICLARRLGDRSRDMHAGVWKKSAEGSVEVRGKTLGIVGYGHIGTQLSIMAEALGMSVVFYDIVPKLPLGNAVALESIGELFAAADFVSLHVPNTPATKNMITAKEIEQMKPGAFLLNLARGKVVDLDALAAALRSGRLGGAAVDVFPEEPKSNGPGFETPLQGLDNVILTPHVAGSTAEAQAMIGIEVAAVLSGFVNSGSTVGSVNFPTVSLPLTRGTHRILNAHANVPGVLRDINTIFAQTGANVRAQVLGTTDGEGSVGYLIVDVEKDTAAETKKALYDCPHSIKTRILF
eukprot:CAMPEP_0174886366 /NCGR_PEP_ID=MMETSP0167-20121228/1596_1 /TAXON_ID=38298 /ORGANISM="Rhodella maculata, Strain CCMP736" /LENGTH=435 /DNA_ID=CAMNT_0016122323 /DNA_START=53 /DNA_END=1360 /DNA_ORIENTATION=-